MSSSKPTLANFLSRPTMDEQLKLVSDFLFKHIPMEGVEIECRLGLLWNDRAFKRLHVNGLLVTAPIRTEDVDCKFLSEVDVNIFAHCNKQLNERLQQIQKDANPNHTMTYRHRVEEDHFYSRSHGQVQRVTVDPETGKTLHSINKKKIATLDFHNPHPQSLDFRIMASTENKEAIDTINGTCTMIRKKDRISYAFDIWSIDLTKVHTWNKVSSTGPIPVGLGDPKTSYEIELEMVNNEYVRAECNKARQNKENQLLKIAASLLDNLRTLSKFAFPSAAQRSQVQSHHSTSSSSSSSNKRPNPSTTSTTSRPSPSSSSSPNRPSPASASGPAHHPWSEEAQPDQHDDHEINGNDAKRHKTDHGTDTEKTDT